MKEREKNRESVCMSTSMVKSLLLPSCLRLRKRIENQQGFFSPSSFKLLQLSELSTLCIASLGGKSEANTFVACVMSFE